MKECDVKFIKIYRYRIKANSIEEAKNKAFEVKKNDVAWVIDPVDKIEIEELGEVEE